MGYRSERDKDGNKIPRERSGKPRRHRNDRLDLSKQMGTPVYPPSSSIYSHAQPFYLPNTQNTFKPRPAPEITHSDPRSAPSDRPHHLLTAVHETPRSSRPAPSQEDRRTAKHLFAKIPPPVKTPTSVGQNESSAASMETSRPPVPLAETRDSHRIKGTHASIQDPFIDSHKVADPRKASSTATRKLTTDNRGSTPRDPFTDSHRSKDAHAASRDSFHHPHNITDAHVSRGAAVPNPFPNHHHDSSPRPSSSGVNRATYPSKTDVSRRMPGASPEPEAHSGPRSALSSTATLHAPIPTRPQPRRPVLPSIHPFQRPAYASAHSLGSSSTPHAISPRAPQVSSETSSSVSNAQPGTSSSQAPRPSNVPYLLANTSPHLFELELELEQNPWSSPSPPPLPPPPAPIPRRRSPLKRAPPRRNVEFAETHEVRMYGEDEAPRDLSK